jgi:hypothetical protein
LDLARLDEIAEAALAAQPPRYGLFIRVTVARARIRREIVEVGQSLGVYPCVAVDGVGARERATRFRDLFPVADLPCPHAGHAPG